MINQLDRNSLKPPGTIEVYSELVQQDVRDLHLSSRSHLNTKLLNCPLCDCENVVDTFSKYSFTHSECQSCGFVFTNPRPSSSFLKQYYSTSSASSYFQANIIEPTREYRIKHIFAPRARWLDSLFEFKGSILDIGCSTGFLLEEMRNLTWQVFGSEYSDTAASILNSKSIPNSSNDISDTNTFKPSSYDLVTLFEVLEHISDFRETLLAIHTILKTSGKLVISVPNIKSFEFDALKTLHTNICPPAHLNYFSPSNIRYLEQFGFELSLVETPGLLDVSNVLSMFNDGKIQGLSDFEFNLLTAISSSHEARDAFQLSLQSALYSGHLRAVFIKK